MAITLASEEGRKTGYSAPITYRGPGQMLQHKLQSRGEEKTEAHKVPPFAQGHKGGKWQSQE